MGNSQQKNPAYQAGINCTVTATIVAPADALGFFVITRKDKIYRLLPNTFRLEHKPTRLACGVVVESASCVLVHDITGCVPDFTLTPAEVGLSSLDALLAELATPV